MRHAIIIMITALMMSGCMTNRIPVTEQTEYRDHESLGILEISREVRDLCPWSRDGEGMKNALDRALSAAGKENYGADAVTGVQYWPQPLTSAGKNGKIHARGEMIRLKPFPGQTLPSAKKRA